MITVWGRRNSVNVQKVMWTLGELELDYQRHDVAGSFGQNDSNDYLAMNPNGVVPTLQDGELTLWESHVIVRYLARTYGQGSLWPTDPTMLAHADQWMDWITSTFIPPFLQLFFNKVRKPAEKVDAVAMQRGHQDCEKLLASLENWLEARAYIAGGEFSMGDVPTGAVLNRYFNIDIEHTDFPNIQIWLTRLRERPSYQKHVVFPIGTNPEEWLAFERAGAGIQ